MWFWLVAVLGAALRLLWVFGSQGSYDVGAWEEFARSVHADGLIEAYRAHPKLNHPPVASWLAALLSALADASGLPFRVWFRLPVAALDAATAWLLLDLLRSRPTSRRWVAAWWLLPLAPLYSAFHGNTDSVVGLALVLALWLRARDHRVATALVLGLSSWIKLPGLLAAPVFFFALPDARARLRFAALAGATALAGYLPALVADPGIVIQRVLLYGGQIIHTTAGIPVWGVQIFYPFLRALPAPLRALAAQLVEAHHVHNTLLCLALVTLYAWLRRRERAPFDVARSVAFCFVILYGVSNFWSFQYFAWSLPLWLLAGPVFAVASLGLANAYVYGLYAWLCGDPLLLGPWDFLGHPHWPLALLLARNLCVLFFLGAACTALFAALRAELRHRFARYAENDR